MKVLIIFTVLLLELTNELFSQTTINVFPDKRSQTIEGWGGSLCWWANFVGDWPDSSLNEICDWITSPTGLNMNIFRYNIGGGDNPAHNHFRFDAGVPGFKVTETSPYDWTRDANQRNIALKLKARRPDIIFEGFSNSPPYWMTISGCSAGNTDGSPNLKLSYYTAFADYLTEVTKYYHDSLGITFRTLEPFNEPFSNWWKANGRQEGCQFCNRHKIQ